MTDELKELRATWPDFDISPYESTAIPSYSVTYRTGASSKGFMLKDSDLVGWHWRLRDSTGAVCGRGTANTAQEAMTMLVGQFYTNLMAEARKLPPMTPRQRREQALDFAYGNLACTTNHKPSRAAFEKTALDAGWSKAAFDAWAAGRSWSE